MPDNFTISVLSMMMTLILGAAANSRQSSKFKQRSLRRKQLLPRGQLSAFTEIGDDAAICFRSRHECRRTVCSSSECDPIPHYDSRNPFGEGRLTSASHTIRYRRALLDSSFSVHGARK
jgi:hypothetical protein